MNSCKGAENRLTYLLTWSILCSTWDKARTLESKAQFQGSDVFRQPLKLIQLEAVGNPEEGIVEAGY